ncbi:MAG: hypothetical protein WCD35_08965 [Mycobacteriales bacterium]
MDGRRMTSEPGSGSGQPPTSGLTTTDTSEAEVARLRAERDAAIEDKHRLQRRMDKRGRTRRVLVGLLVVVFAVLLPVAVTATWAHRTVLNTSAYVSTVTPIASDPAVTAAVSREVTNQLYDALDPQAIIADALPPKAAFLAGPIATGAKDNVQGAVDKVLRSDQFQQLWVGANRFAHARLVSVLRGDTKVLQTTNGQVVLNLVPLLNEALKNAQDFASGVVGKPITLPTITSDELPSAACEKISAALDRPLPATCGQIALFPSAKLESAQRAVRWFDGAVLALLVVTPLLAVAALALSRRRRRTLLQLTIGGMLGLVVVRRAVMWEQNQLIATGKPENKAARTAIVEGVLNGFFDVSLWFLVGGLVIVLLALLTGPYAYAVALRRRLAAAGRRTGNLLSAGAKGTSAAAQEDSTVLWVRRHVDVLRVAGVAVAVLLLLVVSVNFWGFLVIVGLLALYEAWLHRLRPPTTITLPPSAPQAPPPAQPAG